MEILFNYPMDSWWEGLLIKRAVLKFRKLTLLSYKFKVIILSLRAAILSIKSLYNLGGGNRMKTGSVLKSINGHL